MADAETTPGLKPNLDSRHEPTHIGTYALPGPNGSTGVVELFEEGDLQARGGFQPRVE